MKRFFTASLIFLTVTSAAAAENQCADVFSSANSDIPNFGGLKPKTQLQEMANMLLAYAPREGAAEVQIGIPIVLESTLRQGEQFGDGQRNALATYGQLSKAPFVAILTRTNSSGGLADLAIHLLSGLPALAQAKTLELSILGVTQKLDVSAGGEVHLWVDTEKLNWQQLYDTKAVFFRPVGWTDWFAVQFPYAYVTNDQLVSGLPPSFQTLPSGQSIIDPLGLAESADVQNDLRRVADSANPGFILARTERSQRVHGAYLLPDGAKILTGTGGIWTRYRIGDPFKIVYLAKDARVLDIEEEEGVVSGTGPHYIGATAEIIVNSLGKDPLMTFYGVPSPQQTPDGGKIAWNLTHQWIGSWLRPGQSFVTPQGMYHWHLNHLARPVAAQVFTPPLIPNSQNHFGFPGTSESLRQSAK